MSKLTKPDLRPANPNFSSGPCAKRPGYSLQALEDACLGRSHRSKPGKAKLAEDFLGSSAQDTYQDMMDRELSSQLSGRVNLGIAEALVRQLGQGKAD